MSERFLRLWRLLAAVCLLLAACAQASGVAAFPKAGGLSGWQEGERESYTREDLYSLVNGQAESFFAYGFESVQVQPYTNDTGVTVRVEVWQLDDASGAYGLWTAMRSGQPASTGVDSDTDGVRRIAFWQERSYVQIIASQTLDADTIDLFAGAVSAALPQGGERPALAARLRQDGLQPGSLLYFREEMSVQNELWLGGENMLGLSQETAGVTARYTLDGQEVRLLLVQYPTGSQANQALTILQNIELEGLLVSGVQGDRLGAIFGEQTSQAAVGLLQEALAP